VLPREERRRFDAAVFGPKSAQLYTQKGIYHGLDFSKDLTGRNVAVDEYVIPDDLRRKVPRMMLMYVDQPTFGLVFGLGLAVFMLHGPVVGQVDYNGLRFLLAPWLCSPFAAACHVLRPYNPYRGTWAEWASMIDKDHVDADAKRLRHLFRSAEARRFLLRASVKTSLMLFVAMTLLAVAHRKSLNWTLVSPWLGQGLIGGFFGAFVALKTQFLNWGVKRWAASNAAK
jgi:hypothetical protein